MNAVPARDGPSLRRWSPSHAAAQHGRLLELYAKAFAGPPWCESPAQARAHSATLRERLARPDVQVWVAEVGTHLVGAAYGWQGAEQLPAGGPYGALRDLVNEQVLRRHTSGRPFEVVELMVHPDARRRGIGSRLLELLRADQRAWLLTHPDGEAVRLYLRHGWVTAADSRTRGGRPLLLMAPDAGE